MSVGSISSEDTLVAVTPEDQNPSPLYNIKRHEDFWFKDGSVILITGGTAFRVYRGLLEGQSTVFSDIFTSMSADLGDKRVDGCPIAHLSDSPHDMAHLLHVLIPKSRRQIYAFPVKTNQTHDFDQVSALIRLAHKYRILDVRDQALGLLRQYFTDDFDCWLRRGCVPIGVERVHAISVVNLARLINEPSLLPTALYLCCNLGGALLDGYKPDNKRERVETLSMEDLKLCFDAREKLSKEGIWVFSQIFYDVTNADCAARDRCSGAIREIVASAVRKNAVLAADCNPLLPWTSVLKAMAAASGLCGSCEKELHRRDVDARREVWNVLPRTFGIEIPNWGKDSGSVSITTETVLTEQ